MLYGKLDVTFEWYLMQRDFMKIITQIALRRYLRSSVDREHYEWRSESKCLRGQHMMIREGGNLKSHGRVKRASQIDLLQFSHLIFFLLFFLSVLDFFMGGEPHPSPSPSVRQ